MKRLLLVLLILSIILTSCVSYTKGHIISKYIGLVVNPTFHDLAAPVKYFITDENGHDYAVSKDIYDSFNVPIEK